MIEYRRLKHRQTWHFMTNCQHWRNMKPSTYLSVDLGKRPSYGELCNECLGKEKRAKKEALR